MEHFDLLSIFVIAFFASLGPCVGMCGGLIIAYTRAKIHNPSTFARNALSHLLYVCGRVCMYMVLGGIFGSFGAIFTHDMHTKAIMGVGVGALLLLFGFRFCAIPLKARICYNSASF